MTAEKASDPEPTEEGPSTGRILAACKDCGRASTARYTADGRLIVYGSTTCPGCGGTNLKELTMGDDGIDTSTE